MHANMHASALQASDTSTGIVLNAIGSARSLLGSVASSYCRLGKVTANHFDTDAFLSVWCFLNRELAQQYEPVLRHMARIGDFREAYMSPELVTAFGAEDGLTNVRCDERGGGEDRVRPCFGPFCFPPPLTSL